MPNSIKAIAALTPPKPATLNVRRPPRLATPTVMGDLGEAISGYQESPTPESGDALLLAAAPVIAKAMRAYVGSDSPAARGRAKSIVLGVAPKYDPRAAKPETYLLTHLQSLRRYGASLAAPARIPDRVRLDAPRVDRHAEDLRSELGREPSDAEIADRSGLPIDRIAKARGVGAAFAAATAPEGLEYAVPQQAEAARRAWAQYVYHDLKNPVAQLVMEHTMGLNGKPVLSTGQIARKAGVTAGAVSQHKAKIEQMLAEYARFVGG